MRAKIIVNTDKKIASSHTTTSYEGLLQRFLLSCAISISSNVVFFCECPKTADCLCNVWEEEKWVSCLCVDPGMRSNLGQSVQVTIPFVCAADKH